MFNAIVIIVGLVFLVFSSRDSLFLELGGAEQVVCLALVVATCLPMLRWASRGMRGVPVFESFCMVHFPYYAHPILTTRWQYIVFPTDIRTSTALAVLVFLGCATATYYLAVDVMADRWRGFGRFLDRKVGDEQGSMLCWILLCIWLVLVIMLGFGIGSFGNALNIARAFGFLGGLLGIFDLYRRWGNRSLSIPQRYLLSGILGVGILVQFASGLLVYGSTNILTALVGFAVGRRRVPVLAAVLSILVINFLHLGKGKMRERFWDPELGQGTALTLSSLREIYEYWPTASLEQLFSQKRDEEEKRSIMDRAVLIQYLGYVVAEAPANLPFLNGKTYKQSIPLIIPRILWPGKPRTSLPNETLSIHFGVQTEESVETTTVGMGLIAEAWGNFGWMGVMIVGAFIGWFWAAVAALAVGRTPDSIGFLLAAASINFTFNIEQAMANYVLSFSQSLFTAAIVLGLMARLPLPGAGDRVESEPELNPWRGEEV